MHLCSCLLRPRSDQRLHVHSDMYYRIASTSIRVLQYCVSLAVVRTGWPSQVTAFSTFVPGIERATWTWLQLIVGSEWLSDWIKQSRTRGCLAAWRGISSVLGNGEETAYGFGWNGLMSGGCLRVKKWIKSIQRRKLITSTNPFESHAGSRYNELLDHVRSKVTSDMSNLPLKEYTVEDAEKARNASYF